MYLDGSERGNWDKILIRKNTAEVELPVEYSDGAVR